MVGGISGQPGRPPYGPEPQLRALHPPSLNLAGTDYRL